MRGDQLARQWRVLRLIEANGGGLTVAEIAQREDISLRTAYRDLEALQDAGFPLYCEKADGKSRWAFVESYRFKVPQPFTLTELMSLSLYSDLVKIFKGTPFYDSMESLFKKLRSALPPQTLGYLESMQSSFQVGVKPYTEYGLYREIINQLNEAVVERRRVEMAYKPLRSEQETVRKVDPYKIWFFDGTMYMVGFCHLRHDVRIFTLDRIRMLSLTDERFEPPEDFDLDEFMKHSFKVMRDRLYTVKIRISPAWARYIGEKIWHESQRVERLPDGGIELTLQVAGLEEIKRWVLGLGKEAQVTEPELLREMIRNELADTLTRYGGPSMFVEESRFARS